MNAHSAVQKALKAGRLVKPANCSSCGLGARRIVAHHHKGYADAHVEEVVWLCDTCHRREHRQHPELRNPTRAASRHLDTRVTLCERDRELAEFIGREAARHRRTPSQQLIYMATEFMATQHTPKEIQ